jgi:DNA-binding IclR family transcriptional regulator
MKQRTHQSLERGLRLVGAVALNGARTSLAEAARRSGEGSSLSVYRDGAVTMVAKREHDGPVRVVQDVGARRPLEELSRRMSDRLGYDQ